MPFIDDEYHDFDVEKLTEAIISGKNVRPHFTDYEDEGQRQQRFQQEFEMLDKVLKQKNPRAWRKWHDIPEEVYPDKTWEEEVPNWVPGTLAGADPATTRLSMSDLLNFLRRKHGSEAMETGTSSLYGRLKDGTGPSSLYGRSKDGTGINLAMNAEDVPLGSGLADQSRLLLQLKREQNEALKAGDFDKFDELQKQIQKIAAQYENAG